MKIPRLWLLVALIAAAGLAILSITEVIPAGRLGEVALKTFGVLTVLVAASLGWKVVRGRSDVPDKTDQRVP
jgi:uncharacterized membrane protein YqjE